MLRVGNKWDLRIERARELAGKYTFAAQILTFYSKLTAFQKSSYLNLQTIAGGTGSQPVEGTARRGGPEHRGCATLLDDVDLGPLITRWKPFLTMIAADAPAPLGEFARELNARGAGSAATLLRSYWPGVRSSAPQDGEHHSAQLASRTQPETSHFERFCASAFMQPYAEFLADCAAVPALEVRRPTCPFCGSPPLVGVLRQEGDGAKRSLICSFCRSEWDYLRIACPACEEYREEKLCVYTSPEFECVRVEACESCQTYIKTVDLTKTGLAVPEVDEIAAVPLTLWAEEKGYKKIARNVVGL